ncbi:MAG TPA: leucine--tRNA ligase [Candidatus Limnocylindrales bacterium]|nr:leucine--tRNA ligase [Candidatus Limnocylindrales bacterium]
MTADATKPTRSDRTDRPDRPARVERYDHLATEPKWQAKWDELGLYKTKLDDTRKAYYLLTMYPYPSGDLHIGHWYIKTPTDAIARFHRMHGENVFLPIGFDAFGLPAENAAIKNKINPRDWTMKNIENMRRQLRSMGATFDWDSEVVTADPDYYKWNQWFFLQFLKAGLAYRQKSPVDWCPNDGTLAREQVEGIERRCWRCGAKVEKRDLEQWYLRVTKYADELLDFSEIQFPDPIRTQQTNWIGRSVGAEIVFETAPSASHAGGEQLRVFTTRPDTLFGATFMVVAPEHPLVGALTAPEKKQQVEAYIAKAQAQTEIERLSTDREKTGVAIGAEAINPVNGERIPIFVADYVLGGYGTGAIMAVPAHDERDFAFAKKFGLPVRRVVAAPGDESKDVDAGAYIAHSDDERLVNSGSYSGLSADEGGRRIVAMLEAQGTGKQAVTYRLRDWLISRQRYWGTPIPIIYCPTHGAVPVPESDLPVRLPDEVDYEGSGVNPLTRDEKFLNVPCPICGEPAQRETDTMDTFMDSSWYWYRYLSPHKQDGPIDLDLTEGWTPVAQYTGGAEHAVMHLLYAREFTKMMRDLGMTQQNEPWRRVFNQGQILGMDGERMSKSRGNVQDPDELVTKYGADTVRLFLMFMGPWDQGGPWSPTGIGGVHRFITRVWALALDPHYREPGDPLAGTLPDGQSEADARAALRAAAHKTLREVTADYEAFHFNTMVAKLMELANTLFRYRGSSVAGGAEWDEAVRLLLLMLAPAAPHVTEELWSRRLAARGEAWSSIHTATWPEVDTSAVLESTREVPVQVNGKVRDRITVAANASAATIEAAALASEKVQAYLAGRVPERVIQAGGGRLVNVVVREG